ncbi:PEP-CTERM sorting domain-containing protein [bacterium]|nr:PEP-CTERM sorting domain-containing protein [bacterium]
MSPNCVGKIAWMVPEPAVMVLLAVAAMAANRRRR